VEEEVEEDKEEEEGEGEENEEEDPESEVFGKSNSKFNLYRSIYCSRNLIYCFI